MTTPEFQRNEIVDVTIRGVRFARVDDTSGVISVFDEFGNAYPLPPRAEIARVAPAEWPPRPEDLWRDSKGRLWFGRSQRAFVTTGTSREETPDRLLADYGPLTLIHRERHEGGEG